MANHYRPSHMPIYHPAHPASPSNPMNPLSPVWIGKHHSKKDVTTSTQATEKSPVVSKVKAGEMSGDILVFSVLAGVILGVLAVGWCSRPSKFF